MYLTKLQEDQKLEICLLRIMDAATYKTVSDYIQEAWQAPATPQTVGNFFRSEEGEQIMEKAYKKLRKEYSQQPLIEKSTRLLAYRDQMLKIRAVMNSIPVGDEGWLELSVEFRQYGNMIFKETEGMHITIDDQTPMELALIAALATQEDDESPTGEDL